LIWFFSFYTIAILWQFPISNYNAMRLRATNDKLLWIRETLPRNYDFLCRSLDCGKPLKGSLLRGRHPHIGRERTGNRPKGWARIMPIDIDFDHILTNYGH